MDYRHFALYNRQLLLHNRHLSHYISHYTPDNRQIHF